VTDGQTDGQTELRWLRRAEAEAAFARKKCNISQTITDTLLEFKGHYSLTRCSSRNAREPTTVNVK